MDKNFINQTLDEMDNEVDRLTSGNVSHKKASLKWGIHTIKKELNDD